MGSPKLASLLIRKRKNLQRMKLKTSITLIFALLLLVKSGSSIFCWSDNDTEKNCNEEIQREEIYCRNRTSIHGKVSRDCFALQWFEDRLGCHENEDEDIVCVCATDFCNGPAKQRHSGASSGFSSPVSSLGLPLVFFMFRG